MPKGDPPASPTDELDRLRARVAELEARLAERPAGHPEADLPASRFSQVFRSSPAAVLITRVDGDQVLDVNESFLRMCGLAREEVIGRSAQALWKDPTHRDDMLVTIAEFGSVRDVEAAIRSSGGEYRRGRVSAEVLELGSDRCLIWQIVDITDAKRTELALRRTRERYRSLTDDVLDNAPVGIFLLDSEFRVVWINRPVERYFGLRREEILGQDKRRIVEEQLCKVLHDPEEFRARVLGAYERGRHIEGIECRVRAGDEREDRWLRYWSQPIRTGLYAGV